LLRTRSWFTICTAPNASGSTLAHRAAESNPSTGRPRRLHCDSEIDGQSRFRARPRAARRRVRAG
jgi:hypothetical protein